LRYRRAARIVCALFGASIVAITAWVAWPIPGAQLARGTGDGVTIEDRSGVVLRSTRAADGSNSTWVPYDRIDADVINAFVAVEDRRFWTHHGIDARAFARAVRDNLRAGRVVSGASTITMQLARLVQPAKRSWGGKVAQALFALRIEAHLSKQQIMEQYLNRVELGQGTVGIAAAAQLYFNTSAAAMSIGQAAMLAGLAHAPSRDNPHVSLSRARARRALALARMRRAGVATRDDAMRAKTEPLTGGVRASPFLAPHFTTRVLSWMARERDVVRTARIRTSLDAPLQAQLESEVRHTVDALGDRGVGQAAVVVLDNASGEVLAWVGSPDFWASGNGQTDMVASPRQPGSALKPFLYGLALDRGTTAATVLPDIPKTYSTAAGSYHPRDYDRRFRGPTRVREALASSYNVPAVELASRLGASSLLQTLHRAGFASLDRDAGFYGLGLALGNGDVTLIELANAYRALANGGEWRPWTWQRAAPGAATAASRDDHDAHRVMSRVASTIILDILADPVARMPGFGFQTPFDFPFSVAVKTGTSRHFTDNWAVGTTRGFTVAVWAGNFNGRPMEGVSGVTGAGPLLHRAIMATASRVSPGVLESPADAGAVSVPVCRLSGMRATAHCAKLDEWFVRGTEPTREDDWEQGGRIVLPDEYAEWTHEESQQLRSERTVLAVAAAEPLKSTERHSVAAEPSGLRILSPLDGDRYSVPPGVEARFASIPLKVAGASADAVEWSVDGKLWTGSRLPLEPGAHVIGVKSATGERTSVRIVVER
jgi:penicillin-binding protein 1C